MSSNPDCLCGLAHVKLPEGLEDGGGLCYEGQDEQITDKNRERRPQAESIVDFLNPYELSGERSFLEVVHKA